MLHRLLLCLALLGSPAMFAQLPLSDSATVSLVTVAPGAELYSIYGHSALRVRDRAQNLDRVFNYGTFDFDQPGFVVKFMRGKLLYYLNPEPGRAFERGNLADRRGMVEQELNLSREQKQHLFDLLRDNLHEENKFYKYDFFYDNCATRIRDIVKKPYDDRLAYSNSAADGSKTMRQLLNPYLAPYPWTDFGIDIILGMPADKIATPEDHMFLPDGMFNAFAQTRTPEGQPLVAAVKEIPSPYPPEVAPANALTGPMTVSILVLLLGLATLRYPKAERIFNTVFYLVLGIAGLIIFFLWFLTDHQATKNNLNLFWALPTNLLFLGGRQWRYLRLFTGGAAAFVLLLWPFGVQDFPVAALPLVVLVVVKGFWPEVQLKMRR